MSWFNHPFLLRLSVLWGSQTIPDCILYCIPRWLAQCLAHCRCSVNICWMNERMNESTPLGPNTMPEHTLWFRNLYCKKNWKHPQFPSSVPPFFLLGYILILSIPSERHMCVDANIHKYTAISLNHSKDLLFIIQRYLS